MPDDDEDAAAARRRFLQEYFAVLGERGDVSGSFTARVSWTEVDTGERFEGPARVAERIDELHHRAYAAHPAGRALTVTADHAFLEGDFVGTAAGVRVPFCLVYDFEGPGISAMRLYTSTAALRALAR